MYAQNRNVTYIDELPNLEDLESRSIQNITSQFPEQDDQMVIPDKFKKFIRPSMGQPPDQSGMSTNPHQHQHQHQHQYQHQHQPSSQEFFNPPVNHQENTTMEENYKMLSNTPSCLDIHSHVLNCPICSRFFKNDNAVYIIAIVVLSIICILLLKRVLKL